MTTLSDYEVDLEDLTDAEEEIYRAVEIRGRGPREVARRTGRAPGTVGNLLARAREKVDPPEVPA